MQNEYEKLIEDQAIEIQKLRTIISELADDLKWEQEVKNAWKSKYLRLKEKLERAVVIYEE